MFKDLRFFSFLASRPSRSPSRARKNSNSRQSKSVISNRRGPVVQLISRRFSAELDCSRAALTYALRTERGTMRKTCLTLRSRHSKQSVCAVGQLKEDAATEKEEIADWISLLHEAVIDQLVREINSPAINLVSPGFDMWGNLSARVHAKSESKAKQLRWSMRKCLCNYCKTRRDGVWQTKGGT